MKVVRMIVLLVPFKIMVQIRNWTFPLPTNKDPMRIKVNITGELINGSTSS